MLHYYTRGDGTLFTCPNRIVYLPRALTGEQISAIWEDLLVAPASLIGTLEVITKGIDPTFETLPSFIAIYLQEPAEGHKTGHRDIRVAVRGDLSLSLVTATQEEQTFSGAAATMWREESAQNVRMLGVGNFQSCSLPLYYGVSYSGGFIWTGEDTAMDLSVSAGAQVQTGPPTTPDLGETLTELPEEWFESQPPRSTAPLLAQAPPVAQGATATQQEVDTAAPEPDQSLPPAPPSSPQSAPATAVLNAPYFGSVQFAHGQEVDLGDPIVVGRKPSIAGSGAQPGAILVTVPSPSKDISRNHLGIHVEQGYVIATDLGSVNGTMLKRSGQPDRKLNPREGTLILNGDILDLGDSAILSFHEIA